MRAIAGIAEIAGIGVNEVHTHTMRGVAGKAAAGAGVLFESRIKSGVEAAVVRFLSEKSYKKRCRSSRCSNFILKNV